MIKSEIIRKIALELEQNGIEAADFEAKELVEAVVGRDYSAVAVTSEQETEIARLLDRRLKNEPLQYILGEWEFYGLPIKVGKGVLIPRPDTETVVECALKKLKGLNGKKVFDLCAGSGCIGLALAVHGRAEVVFFENSPKALSYLLSNIKLNGVKAETYDYDVLSAPPDGLMCDVLVSNPPYIRTEVIETLSEEVKKEPKTALDGGYDGLTFYRHIAKSWKPAICDGGWLIFEIGFDQAAEVTKIMEAEGYKNVSLTRDLGGNDRVIMGQK